MTDEEWSWVPEVTFTGLAEVLHNVSYFSITCIIFNQSYRYVTAALSEDRSKYTKYGRRVDDGIKPSG